MKYINIENSNDGSYYPYKIIITSKDHRCYVTVAKSRDSENHTVVIFKQEPSTPSTLKPLITSAGTVDREEIKHSL